MRQLDPRTAARWTLAAVAILASGSIVATSMPTPAEAQVGGYSQVTRLEIKYQVADGTVEVRFHLASGIALTQKIEGETAIDRLHEMAQVFSQEDVRLFVSAADDRVVSWTLSIP